MSEEYDYDEYRKSPEYQAYSQSAVQGDAPVVNQAPYSDAPVYGTQQMPVTEDAYIRRIDEMAREREEEKKPKKHSFIASAFGFLMLALLMGVIAGGTYFGLEKYFSKDDSKQSTSNSSVDSSNKHKEGELAPTKAIELAQSGELGESKASAVTAADVSAVVDSVMPAVVAINSYATRTVYDFWGDQGSTSEQLRGSGSGIIIGQNSGEVLIVTNNHVIADADRVEIVFCDESKVEATIKGKAASSDLAVVAVPFSELPSETADVIRVARIGNSDSVKVGQIAIAIGNALGYGQSVTVGYISALNRQITIDNVTYTLIQTDAAINPGNSGGALLNQYGEVIAINSAKYSDYSVEGMGFAIPISNVREIIEELSNREHLDDSEKGYIGIGSAQDLTSEYSTMLGMPQGVYVQEVIKGSPAEEGGLRAGDIITKINNENITGIGDIQEIMSYTRAGAEVTVTVARRTRSGEFEETDLKIVLGSYEEALNAQKKDSK
ncbi:MAG: trypsin-like peptidase domain-containing protein [Lachnospiraceae bacterium]|nr:trypsin-like peptidase domain-containing protein [Lachnospiraceae bacterium]